MLSLEQLRVQKTNERLPVQGVSWWGSPAITAQGCGKPAGTVLGPCRGGANDPAGKD